MIFRRLALVAALAAAIAPAPGAAGEREALAHIARELTTLGALVDTAAARAAPAVRTERYRCLRADLQEMRAGIVAHIAGPRGIPREPPGLCLDYFALASRAGTLVTGGEASALARLTHALAALAPLVDAAKRQAAGAAGRRVRFRYDWLHADLAHVRGELDRMLAAPRTVPRTFPPMAGEHRPPRGAPSRAADARVTPVARERRDGAGDEGKRIDGRTRRVVKRR